MPTATPIPPFRRLALGTRGSPLALVQAGMVRDALLAQEPEPGTLEVAIVPIRTTGDRVQDRPLAEAGGKGLFTKELDEALLDRRIDMAVHSLKDVPAALPDGIVIAAVLERADPRDVLIARGGERGLLDLPRGAVLGTCSPRRAAQALACRPDLAIYPLRGNVGTRLARLAEGTVGATLLAAAGLDRLGLRPEGAVALEPEAMLPAVAQGVVGIAARAGDDRVLRLLARIDHGPTHVRARAERAMLEALGGSCRTPIAGHARAAVAGEGGGDGGIVLEGLVASPDGRASARDRISGGPADAARLGRELGLGLKGRSEPAWFEP